MTRTHLLMTFALFLVPHMSLAECVTVSVSGSARFAAVVFSGTAMNVAVNTASEWPSTIVAFDVDRVWKGEVTKQFVVYSFTRTTEGLDFKAGKKYLVLAHAQTPNEREDLKLVATPLPVFVVGQCGDGTREMARIPAPEIADMGPWTAPSR